MGGLDPARRQVTVSVCLLSGNNTSTKHLSSCMLYLYRNCFKRFNLQSHRRSHGDYPAFIGEGRPGASQCMLVEPLTYLKPTEWLPYLTEFDTPEGFESKSVRGT